MLNAAAMSPANPREMPTTPSNRKIGHAVRSKAIPILDHYWASSLHQSADGNVQPHRAHAIAVASATWVLILAIFLEGSPVLAQATPSFDVTVERVLDKAEWKIMVRSKIGQSQSLYTRDVAGCILKASAGALTSPLTLEPTANLDITATGTACKSSTVTFWSDFGDSGTVVPVKLAARTPDLTSVQGLEKRELTLLRNPFKGRIEQRRKTTDGAATPCKNLTDAYLKKPDVRLTSSTPVPPLMAYNDAKVAMAPCLVGVFHPATYSGKLGATTLTVHVKDHWGWPTGVLVLSALIAWVIGRWRSVLFPLAMARRDLGDLGLVLTSLDDHFDGTAYAIRDGFTKDVHTLYSGIDLAEHSEKLTPEKLNDFKKQAAILHSVPAAWKALKTKRAALSEATAMDTFPPGMSAGWREVVSSLLRGQSLGVAELPAVTANLERAALTA